MSIGIHRIYHALMELLERRVLGSRIQEVAWATRHLFHRQWAFGYQATLAHPHRPLLVETIARHTPDTVLEVGCNVGVNLFLLSERLPDCMCYGVDINRAAIRHGRRWLSDRPRIHLQYAVADKLPFSDRSMGTVFTDAVLMCVGPDKITRTMHELCRVARQVIVLNEFLCSGPSRYLDGHWAHDYASLGNVARARSLPRGAWDDPLWQRYGHIIEISAGPQAERPAPLH